MGQRSQIYIRYDRGTQKELIANYYQWNYAENMISRARYGIEMIIQNIGYGWYCASHRAEISQYFDVNFDLKGICAHRDLITDYLTE